MDFTVPRVRLLLEPDGSIRDFLGFELLAAGELSEVRADGVTEESWGAGTWVPWEELPGP